MTDSNEDDEHVYIWPTNNVIFLFRKYDDFCNVSYDIRVQNSYPLSSFLHSIFSLKLCMQNLELFCTIKF